MMDRVFWSSFTEYLNAALTSAQCTAGTSYNMMLNHILLSIRNP